MRIIVALALLLLAVVPGRIALSAGALMDSATAFARGDCATAVDRALDATGALDVRPEPFAILAYCDVRLGFPELAVRAMKKAVSRDPGNWEYTYGLALVAGQRGARSEARRVACSGTEPARGHGEPARRPLRGDRGPRRVAEAGP